MTVVVPERASDGPAGSAPDPAVAPAVAPLNFTTLAVMAALHAGGLVGLVLMVTARVAWPTVGVAAVLWIGTGLVDHGRVPPPVRPPQLPGVGSDAVDVPGVRGSGVPELGAGLERRPP